MNQAVVLAELHGAVFRKSSYSNPNQDCVEIGRTAAALGVRDSKLPRSPILAFDAAPGQAFLAVIRAGQFDL